MIWSIKLVSAFFAVYKHLYVFMWTKISDNSQFSVLTIVLYPVLSYLFHGFLKNWMIHQLEKSFSNQFFSFFLSSVFTLMYGFSQAFWLTLITLCIFCNSNLYDVMLVWKFLRAQRIHFYHGNYAQVIQMSCLQRTGVQTFKVSFFLIKVLNNCVFCVIVQDIQHQLYKYPTSLSLLRLH